MLPLRISSLHPSAATPRQAMALLRASTLVLWMRCVVCCMTIGQTTLVGKEIAIMSKVPCAQLMMLVSPKLSSSPAAPVLVSSFCNSSSHMGLFSNRAPAALSGVLSIMTYNAAIMLCTALGILHTVLPRISHSWAMTKAALSLKLISRSFVVSTLRVHAKTGSMLSITEEHPERVKSYKTSSVTPTASSDTPLSRSATLMTPESKPLKYRSI
mmetsp:Transcript_7888/g.11659  ORF Transcript_7888/g.11659 Transcript_7888/m.11659 type:complete len:213 (+) Transcript_7888:2165-2803(+)